MSATIGFVLAACVTLVSSLLLVTRLERLGARLGFTQAILGLVTALAANAPEITSAVTAMSRGQREVGIGVVLGSNVFNLAALLGLGALVGPRIELHRRVILLVGGVSVWIALASLATVTGTFSLTSSLVLALVVFLTYVTLSAWPHAPRRMSISKGPRSWIRETLREEESEIASAIHPSRGDWRDAVIALFALGVVVVASIVMEHTATTLGGRLGWSNILIGGVVLAGVTSLPNAVAAVYFARRGMGAALLSEALNSNNLNAIVGFMIPAAIIGVHSGGVADLKVAYFYVGLTLVSLALAYSARGLTRTSGALIVAGYVAFVVVLTL